MKLYTRYLTPAAVRHSQPKPIAGMNITPLIDVLMVLVVMLIITIPAPVQMLGVSMLPRQTVMPMSQMVVLQINAQGFVTWNDDPVEKISDLTARIASAAAQKVQPEIGLYIAPDTPYAFVASVLVLATKAGLEKVAVLN